MRYFRIAADNTNYADRWFLDEPLASDGHVLDAREFTYGQPYLGPSPLQVPIQYPGDRVSFNLAAFDMPVVTQEIIGIVETIAPAEIEYFPVLVGTSFSGYAILNAIHREACVDEEKSHVTRWAAEDYRTDRVGRYRMVSNLHIDPRRTQGRHIFRIADFEIALIAS